MTQIGSMVEAGDENIGPAGKELLQSHVNAVGRSAVDGKDVVAPGLDAQGTVKRQRKRTGTPLLVWGDDIDLSTRLELAKKDVDSLREKSVIVGQEQQRFLTFECYGSPRKHEYVRCMNRHFSTLLINLEHHL